MVIVLTIIHVLVCFFLVVVVLLQSGKAADLAGAFGGMGSQTAFGPRGSATVLSKATTVAAAVFMMTSLTLAIMATRSAGGSGSVLEKQKAPTKAPVAAPASGGQSTVPLPGGAPGQAPGGAQAPPGAVPVTGENGKTPTVTIMSPDGTKKTMPLPDGVKMIPQQQQQGQKPGQPQAPAQQPPAGAQTPAKK